MHKFRDLIDHLEREDVPLIREKIHMVQDGWELLGQTETILIIIRIN